MTTTLATREMRMRMRMKMKESKSISVRTRIMILRLQPGRPMSSTTPTPKLTKLLKDLSMRFAK